MGDPFSMAWGAGLFSGMGRVKGSGQTSDVGERRRRRRGFNQKAGTNRNYFRKVKNNLSTAQRIGAFRFKNAIDNASDMEICIISGINGPDLTRIGARFPNNGTDSHEIIYYEKT